MSRGRQRRGGLFTVARDVAGRSGPERLAALMAVGKGEFVTEGGVLRPQALVLVKERLDTLT